MSLVAGPGRGGFSDLPTGLQLYAQKHVDYIRSLDTRKDELEYWLTEHLRMSGIYWGLTPLYLLGQPDALPRSGLLDFVVSCLHENGGFGAAPGHDPHILYTVSAVQILAIMDAFADLEQRVPGAKDRIGRFIASLQQPENGTFAGDEWGETDTRFLYGAFNALSLLGLMHLVDVEKAIDHVQSCANFDGGYGTGPGAESHSGQVFTCVGTLAIANRLDLVDIDKLGGWLSERQLPNGGLNGRPEKLEDVCYSWWVVSSLAMIDRIHWIDQTKLAEFILKCQDPNLGGISDRAGDMVDVFHTHFGIAGLSLLQYPGLQKIDPVYCMPKDVTDRVLGRTNTVTLSTSTSLYNLTTNFDLSFQTSIAMRPPKMRITARVLKPPDLHPEPPTSFIIPVDQDATFASVWELIQQRYSENYRAGRRNDCYFKKLQDSSGADIDMRDIVVDIFGAIADPFQRIVQIQQLRLDRDDTVPFDSHLHPPISAFAAEENEETKRKRLELSRYGATLDNLDPDHPVESGEGPVEKRIDHDGFAIPARINRPSTAHFPPSSQTIPSSQPLSQNSYEDHLVRSPELGSPHEECTTRPHLETPPKAANTASQYTTLDAVPSAQKPPNMIAAHNQTTVAVSADRDTAHDLADPISEDSQPRLSSSIIRTPAGSSKSKKRKSLDSSEPLGTSTQNLSNLWSEEEKDILMQGIAKGLSHTEIKQQSFPTRSVDSVRKKAAALNKTTQSALKKRRVSRAAAWTDDEDAHFVHAIRNNQTWKTLRDHRFRHRSDDSVKFHYAEVRQRLQAEDEAASTHARVQSQSKNGQYSTGPDEKFTQTEDDFLIACRLENVEMKRAAKEFFPLRPLGQVTSRAGSLLNNAKREAAKANPVEPGISPSVEFLFEHNLEARDRIEVQREKARNFKKRSDHNRAREFEEKMHQQSKLSNDRQRTEERREREDQQRKSLEALDKAKKQDEQVKRRRLNDDIKRTSDYNQQMAAWEQQAAINKQAGRPSPSRPNRPLGSSIGTEVLTTAHTPRTSSSKTTPKDTNSGSSSTPATEHSTKRRRSSNVEVQVIITSSKKQKTDTPLGVTPQTKFGNARAASASKVPVISTPKRTAPMAPRSAMAKLGSIRARPSARGQKVDLLSVAVDEEVTPAIASVPATQPVRPGSARQVVQHDVIRNASSPDLPTAKSLRQSKLPFKKNGQLATKSSSTKPTPIPPRPRNSKSIDDSVFISSDEESSYDDNEITDEELNAIVERSEAMYSSSPNKDPQNKDDQGSVHNPQNLLSPRASAMRSSPPVAQVSTQKTNILHGSAALKVAARAEVLRPSSAPRTITIPEALPKLSGQPTSNTIVVADPDTPVLSQEEEMPGLEISTAEDGIMLEEDQIEHATHSTPVFPSSSPEVGAEDEASMTSLKPDADLDLSPAKEVPGSSAMEESGEAIPSNPIPGESRKDISKDRKIQDKRMDPDTDDVEEMEPWRSDSRDPPLDKASSSKKSDGKMPFPKRRQSSFGPFKVPTVPRTTHLNASVQPRTNPRPDIGKPAATLEEKSVATQAMDVLLSPSNSKKTPAKVFMSSIPVQKKDYDSGPFTLPSAYPSEQSPHADTGNKKARRSRRSKNKGSRILGDADLFKPPPSTAPPYTHAGPYLRQTPAKKVNGSSVLEDGQTSKPPSSSSKEDPAKQSAQQSETRRRSLGLEESLKNMMEKGQALGALSQPTPISDKPTKGNRLTSTQPLFAADSSDRISDVVSSHSASISNAGRTINPHAFDWDNAQDTRELIRQADQRLHDAANMAPEDFWQPENLVKMNEEQVLSHMIEQGVQRSMGRIQAAKFASTQPVQGSITNTGAAPRPATQPIMQVDDDSSSSEEEDDSDEEDPVQSMENLARKADAISRLNEARRVAALPNW
ncbi:hypothetical protein E4T38_06901 [Aureobasidium subglaciale]|nr:hypothetical protein E4T38_06901 [Aureobasidium subglaciale]KAI5218515.1 hypothetical protein E4T40_06832 [Aureobasidium subglaciale]KAI5222126.1 hypothetical protein E4T41_06752 [Aureobasidium subglaciale]KAI5259652.1 hypothetical protein E4T46_06730 [Aureobasidium subglaciale]